MGPDHFLVQVASGPAETACCDAPVAEQSSVQSVAQQTSSKMQVSVAWIGLVLPEGAEAGIHSNELEPAKHEPGIHTACAALSGVPTFGKVQVHHNPWDVPQARETMRKRRPLFPAWPIIWDSTRNMG